MSLIDPTVLDSDDFDPIDYINKRFPTENSLEDLDTFSLGLSSQMAALDEELSRAVQSQTASGEQASKEIAEAQVCIDELFNKISDIKAKASQSERMVQEICSDIKKLDYAKSHLQTSITALKRLQMLTTAISQLNMLIKDPRAFKDVANLLDATTQIMKYFENYSSIAIISSTKTELEQLQQELKKHVSGLFKDLGQLIDESQVTDDGQGGKMATLTDSCLIVDALGYSFRQELLEEFVQLQLTPYETLFGPDRPHFTLDQVERRWAWFKRLLKSFDHKYSTVFPQHWKVPLRLALEFFERTKIHLAQLLTMLESKGTSDVHSLLKALQTALRFETEMGSRFDIKSLQSHVTAVETKEKQSPRKGQEKTVSDERLRDDGKLMYVPSHEQSVTREEQDDEHFMKLAINALSGGISSVFDKFLGSYVLLERSNLEELLLKLSQEEDVTATSGGASSSSEGNIFGSSMSMFVFIKNSIKRCTALTCGQTLLALMKEFKSCILQYVELLKSRCPAPLVVMSSPLGGAVSAPVYRLAAGAEVGICHIINTGEYCAEVVPQLEQMIKAKIISNLVDKVDLSAEVDAFNDLVAHALKVLVVGLMDRLEGAFKVIASFSWGTVTQVGEESAYCHQIANALQDALPRIREALSTSFFNTFCNKLATEILQKYQDTIIKQKRITEMGSQQLLLDIYNMKTLLLKLHVLGASSSQADISTLTGRASTTSAPQMYVKIVSQRVTHIESILKLVATPEEVLLERFRVLWSDGTPSDLQLLMSLKGMKRSDQQTLLEGLGVSSNSSSIPSQAFTATSRSMVGVAQTTAATTAGVVGAAASATATAAAYTTQASFSLASSAKSAMTGMGNITFMSRNVGSTIEKK